MCPAGKFSKANAALGDVASECRQCEAQHIAPLAAAAACRRCPGGRYSNRLGSLCLPTCEAGSYIDFGPGGAGGAGGAVALAKAATAAAALNGTGSCARCPAGRASDHLAPRDPDEQLEAKFGAMAEQCKSCAKGKASDARRVACVSRCGAGLRVASNTSSRSPAAREWPSWSCEACPAGQYSSGSHAVADEEAGSCAVCAPNTFQAAHSQSSCTDCPGGKFARGKGSTSCACPAGTVASAKGACRERITTAPPTPLSARSTTKSPFAAGGAGTKPKRNDTRTTAAPTPTPTSGGGGGGGGGGALTFGGQLVLKLRLPRAAVTTESGAGSSLLDQAKAATIPIATERAIAASLATSLGVDSSDVKIKSVVSCPAAGKKAGGEGAAVAKAGCMAGQGDAFTIEFLVILATMGKARELERKVSGANKDAFTKTLVGNLKSGGVTVAVADLGMSTPVASSVGGNSAAGGGPSAATWAAISGVALLAAAAMLTQARRLKGSRQGYEGIAGSGDGADAAIGGAADTVGETAIVRPEEYQSSDAV